MSYFITGGTGFIGKFFIEQLRHRSGPIYVLTREGSEHKLEALVASLGEDGSRLEPVLGDLTKLFIAALALASARRLAALYKR